MIDGKILLTIDLARDGKKDKYKTLCLWMIYHKDNKNANQLYTLIIPYFALDQYFKKEGWYMAVFNNTDNSYALSLSEISQMSQNKVQVLIHPGLIGSPLYFSYNVGGMIRVNNTTFESRQIIL